MIVNRAIFERPTEGESFRDRACLDLARALAAKAYALPQGWAWTLEVTSEPTETGWKIRATQTPVQVVSPDDDPI